MVLEPPGLDPTIAPAAAIGEITHYNIFEGLTRIGVDGAVTGLTLRDVVSGEEREFPVDGVFIFVGHEPNGWMFEGKLDMDNGYIVTDRRMHTNVPGVFAAGDVQDKIFRQAITAAGTGCMAAIEAERFLSINE